MDERLVSPREGAGDCAHTLVRSVLGAMPLAGQAAIELFCELIAPPIERRRTEWMRYVGEKLQELAARGIDLRKLADDPIFTTVCLQASYAALRNHQQEKLEALSNAIVNAAMPCPPDEALQQIFIGLVDSFTVWHLRILKLLESPRDWFAARKQRPPDISMGGLGSILEAAFPELTGRRSLYDVIVRELHARGLIEIESVHGMMSGPALLEERVSEMGRQFLRFIAAPLE